ncbi:ribose 5-phosphate isomerase B [bacterium]|nr:MAG: ribose 5-phosphate isomerase B [bacterium]
MPPVKIAIGADHAGYELKAEMRAEIEKAGYEVIDVGAHHYDHADDYPDFAYLVAEEVASGRVERGVLVCGSGVGASVAANKVPGVRASVIADAYSAAQGVEHDDLNVLVLGGRTVGIEVAKDALRRFLHARFSGEERHVRRLNKVLEIERKYSH